MKEVQIYRCEDCGLEVGLTPPILRPCPACGGDFVSAAALDTPEDRSLYTPMINRIMDSELPKFFDDLDKLMEMAAAYEEYKKEKGIE